jgi:hypothetical protein
VEDTLGDHLDVHGRLAGLARALAVDSMLSDQDKGVGEYVQGGGKAPGGQTHLKFEPSDFIAAGGED